ncbi:hypothetical protein [Pseudoalteromonas sp. B160]|uniref:hypothetical protein n=1 Tax=Pseudoalteromonas sp. B160 TaxID=630414 RepID=UPI00301BC2A8
MSYIRSSATLCFGNFKEAALYFDRVLPINLGRMRGDSDVGDVLVGYPEEIPSVAFSHLIDGVEGDKNYSHATRIFEVVNEHWTDFAKKVRPYAVLSGSSEHYDPTFEHQKFLQAYFTGATLPNEMSIRSIVTNYAKDVGFQNYSVAIPVSDKQEQSDPAITLSNLNLIDADQADWQQVLEIRKDIQSSKQLTRLKLFIHENFDGKPITYIEDDLCRRLDCYEQACKKFGFKTVTSSLSMLLDAKSLQAAVGTGLVAGLFGGPVVGSITAASIELGKVAINIAEKHHDMKSWQDGHELAYIFKTKETLK